VLLDRLGLRHEHGARLRAAIRRVAQRSGDLILVHAGREVDEDAIDHVVREVLEEVLAIEEDGAELRRVVDDHRAHRQRDAALRGVDRDGVACTLVQEPRRVLAEQHARALAELAHRERLAVGELPALPCPRALAHEHVGVRRDQAQVHVRDLLIHDPEVLDRLDPGHRGDAGARLGSERDVASIQNG
jgi:hypothetical protein